MSKNISIAEGGVARQFTNDKLKINLVGGGTEYYVPESGVQLTTKNVTANGTYKASDVGKYGFSQFSVNVPGGNGSAGSDGKPNTSGTGPLPGGAGSAVVGTDPETGNDVAVGVDENGNLVQTTVPSGIAIVTLPTKTSYVYQETMDYTGIVVAAKKKDGTTFTDARYTNGHIPMGELIFPVDKAPAASGGDGSTASLGDYAFKRYTITDDGSSVVPVVRSDSSPDLIGTVFMPGGGVAVSGTPIYCAIFDRALVVIASNVSSSSIIMRGKTTSEIGGGSIMPFYQITESDNVFHAYWTPSDIGTYYTSSVLPHYQEDWPSVLSQLQPGSGIHDSSGTATIPVKWNNPYTGDTHQDTFQITSTPSTGSSSTTTGSSGTEGSGGGGSF